MPYEAKEISKTVRILFPIVVTVDCGPDCAAQRFSLVGFLMFGNLLRGMWCSEQPSETAQNVLANLITIVLRHHRCHPDAGGYVPVLGHADDHAGFGLFCIYFRTVGGVMFCQIPQSVHEEKINPMIGACGISAFR